MPGGGPMFDHVDLTAPAVVVTWDGRDWYAAVAGQRYRSAFLARVDRWVRGTLNQPPRAWINYEFRSGDPHVDKLISEARQSRLAAYIAEVQAQQAARAALADELLAALSQREVGVLLYLSHQRIHQLRAEFGAESLGIVDR